MKKSGLIAALRRGTGAGPSCPPGPKGHFLLGNLPDFGRAPLDFLTRCRRDYGAIVGLRVVHRPVYLLNCPDLIDEVLVRQSRNFIKSTLFYRHLTAIFGQGLLTSEGEFWRRQRHLIAPAFHSERIPDYGELMVRYTERILQNWRAGELRNVHQDMMDLTMRIVARILFAAEIGAEVAEISRTFTAVVEEISARLIRPFVVPAYLPTPGNRHYARGIKQLDRLVYRLIREHRRHGEDRDDVLSLPLAAQDEDGRALSDRQLRDELVTLLLGGHETTAVTLSWTWYLLARHPAAGVYAFWRRSPDLYWSAVRHGRSGSDTGDHRAAIPSGLAGRIPDNAITFDYLAPGRRRLGKSVAALSWTFSGASIGRVPVSFFPPWRRRGGA